MADPAKHKSVSVPKAAWVKANFLKDKIITDTELSISKVIESIINDKGKETWIQKRESIRSSVLKCKGNGFYRVPYHEATKKKYMLNVMTVERTGELWIDDKFTPENYVRKVYYEEQN